MTIKNFDMFKVSKTTKVKSNHLKKQPSQKQNFKKVTSKKYNRFTYTKITIIYKKSFCIKYVIMVKITENKLRLAAKNKGIKDYQNMSKKKANTYSL